MATNQNTNAGNIIDTLDTHVLPQYLGVGFVWAWIYSAFSTHALFRSQTGIAINSDPSWIISAITVVLVFLVSGFVWRKSHIAQRSSVCWAAVGMLAIGSLVSAFPQWLPGNFSAESSLAILICEILGGVMTGIGSGWLVLLWGDFFSFLHTEQVEIVVPLSALITLACSLTFPSLPNVLGTIAVISLPIFSGICLRFSLRSISILRAKSEEPQSSSRIQNERHGKNGATIYLGRNTGGLLVQTEQSQVSIKNTIRICLFLCLCYIAIGAIESLVTGMDPVGVSLGVDIATSLGSLVGIALAVAFISLSYRVDLTAFCRWISPVIIVSSAAMIMGTQAAGFVSDICIQAADLSLQTVIFIYCASLASRIHASDVLFVGLCCGFQQLGVLIGNLLGIGVRPDATAALYLVLILICAVAFSPLIVPSTRQDLAQIQQSATRQTSSDNLETALDKIADRYGLSEREREVFRYLARGRSQTYIREQLVLSKNTVSSHVKHIYQKMNVHSRQELLDIVEKASDRTNSNA